MKADALSFEQTFAPAGIKKFTIPVYQRPYVWSENDEILTLWEDIINAYDETQQRNDGEIDDKLFLGPIVFVEDKNNKTYDIIDGQQRTTTFHILLWTAFNLIQEEEVKGRIGAIIQNFKKESKLQVSRRDANTYLQIVTGEDVVGDSAMAICARFFRERIAEVPNINSFCEFLLDQTQFVVIVADDYASAWNLFIGLNGKGEPLNPTDLIKAYVCGVSKQQMGDVWAESVEQLGNWSTQCLTFLTRYKTKKFITEKDLFKKISKGFPEIITENDIAKYCKAYFLFWMESYDKLSIALSKKQRQNLRLIRGIGRRDITSILFAIRAVYGENSIFNEDLLNILATYEIRMAISRKRSRERHLLVFVSNTALKFTKTNDKGDEVLDITQAIDKIREYCKQNSISDSDFQREVEFSKYNAYPMRCILQQYEEGVCGDRTINEFQLEHLMPQTATTFWYDAAKTKDDNEYSSISNSIGNLFVVSAETNNEVKNKDFDFKKTVYLRDLMDWSISRKVTNIQHWESEDIFKRSQELAEWSVCNWKYE